MWIRTKDKGMGHLGFYFRAKLVLPTLSTKDLGSCYSLNENGGSSALLTLSCIVSVRKSRRESEHSFCRENHQTSVGLGKTLNPLGQSQEGELRKKGVSVRAEGPCSHPDLDPC